MTTYPYAVLCEDTYGEPVEESWHASGQAAARKAKQRKVKAPHLNVYVAFNDRGRWKKIQEVT